MNKMVWRRAAVGAAAGMTAATAGYAWGRLASQAILARGRAGSGTGDGVRPYRHAVTINRPLDEVYEFWRSLPGLARTSEHVVRVDDIGDRRSRWIVEGPGSSELEYIVEIVVEEPGRLIVWRTEESPMRHEGRVAFSRAPAGRGTEIRVEVSLTGSAPADQEPDQLVRDAVRRVKQVLEAGEVIVANGTSSGQNHARHRDRARYRDRAGYRDRARHRERARRRESALVGGPA